MESNIDNFDLDYKDVKLKVQKHFIAGKDIFRILFPSNRHPLIITRTNNPDRVKFWTSVPEGRQKEAEEIGTLIEEYFRKGK